MASWGSCDFHELRDLNERIKAAASEQEMDAFLHRTAGRDDERSADRRQGTDTG